jgi:hypothetical protein
MGIAAIFERASESLPCGALAMAYRLMR